MTSLGRLVAAVREVRPVAAVLRRFAPADAASGDIAPGDIAPGLSGPPSRVEQRVQRRQGARLFRVAWHGSVPPVWHVGDGLHFDWLRCAAMRAARARHASALDKRVTLHDAGASCGLGATSCARPDVAASSHGPHGANARRCALRSDADHLAQLHRITRALARPVLPAPPCVRPRAATRCGSILGP